MMIGVNPTRRGQAYYQEMDTLPDLTLYTTPRGGTTAGAKRKKLPDPETKRIADWAESRARVGRVPHHQAKLNVDGGE